MRLVLENQEGVEHRWSDVVAGVYAGDLDARDWRARVEACDEPAATARSIANTNSSAPFSNGIAEMEESER